MTRYYFILIIIIILFLLRLTSFGSRFANNYSYINDDTRKICDTLYLFNENDKIKIVENLLSESECDLLIKEAENYGNTYGWEKMRHENYPTMDNQFTKKWENYRLVEKKVRTKIYSEIKKMFDIKKEKLGINEMFIVKYSKDGQRELEYHKDGSEFSFIIALNDNYKGGGTYFKNINKNIKLKKGSVLIFSGQNTHKGTYLEDGTRYILTGFIGYGGMSVCQDYYREIFDIDDLD